MIGNKFFQKIVIHIFHKYSTAAESPKFTSSGLPVTMDYYCETAYLRNFIRLKSDLAIVCTLVENFVENVETVIFNIDFTNRIQI